MEGRAYFEDVDCGHIDCAVESIIDEKYRECNYIEDEPESVCVIEHGSRVIELACGVGL